jgi:hypothetical protein
MIDQDIIQRLKVGGIFILQIYKITTGTMTSIFIPQSCGENICSLSENYNNNEIYHKTVLYWNLLSMFTFYVYYMVELYREEWSIKYLDIDNNKSDNKLKEIIVNYPRLDRKMNQLNLFYYKSFIINYILYFIYKILIIILLKDKYYSNATVSCFFSFTLLVTNKLYNSYGVAKQSVKNDKMMSSYMSEFVSFNVIDSDYLESIKDKTEEEKNLKSENIIPNKI